MDTLNEALGLKIPQHVAVILDGNGRWAKKRGLPRKAGGQSKDTCPAHTDIRLAVRLLKIC